MPWLVLDGCLAVPVAADGAFAAGALDCALDEEEEEELEEGLAVLDAWAECSVSCLAFCSEVETAP